VVAKYVGPVRAAEQLTASSGGHADAVQRQYDLARDFQEALTRAGETSRPCQRAANAARELAKAEVLQTEGYDLGDPEVVARGTRRIAVAFQRYTAGAPMCKAGGRVLRSRLVALRSPVPAQAFFRSVRVQGRAPAGARWAVVAIDTRRAECKGGRASKQIANRRFSMSLKLRPGRHDVAVAFCAGRRSAPFRVASARVPGVWVLAAAGAVATASRRESRSLDDRLARNARRFPGISAVWYGDLRTGVTASWNADAVFPAASTVKLGLLVAALDRFGLRSPVSYDLRAMGMWSSNLATNRLLTEVGGSAAGGSAAAQAALARMGATHSTFTGAYRVGTAVTTRVDEPPRISSRVTTARDLAKALYTLHAGALGASRALTRLRLSLAEAQFALGILLSSVPRRDNVGLFRQALGDTPAAQKQGWLSVARHTAAIVYSSGGPKILVLLTYGSNLTLPTAQAYGRSVVRLIRPR
jgi:Beta-lactamase enzyme family